MRKPIWHTCFHFSVCCLLCLIHTILPSLGCISSCGAQVMQSISPSNCRPKLRLLGSGRASIAAISSPVHRELLLQCLGQGNWYHYRQPTFLHQSNELAQAIWAVWLQLPGEMNVKWGDNYGMYPCADVCRVGPYGTWFPHLCNGLM